MESATRAQGAWEGGLTFCINPNPITLPKLGPLRKSTLSFRTQRSGDAESLTTQ